MSANVRAVASIWRFTGLCCLVVLAMIASAVAAAPPPTPVFEYAGPVQRAVALRVMGVHMNADGTFTPTTDWIDAPQINPATSNLDCWDAFGGSHSGAFMTGYPNPFYAGNWQKGDDGKTGDATHVAFAWYVDRELTFVYGLFTGKNHYQDCTGYTVDYSGVVYDFGTLTAGAWYSDADLNGTGLFHTLDADGDGSYIGVLGTSFHGGSFGLHQGAQPLLWGANAVEDGVPLVGTNQAMQYDDLNLDGAHELPGECVNYAYGRYPDPLQAKVGFGNCGNCPSDACGGGETLTVKTKAKAGQCQVKAILKHGVASSAYGFSMPTGVCMSAATNDKGKAVVKEFPSRNGSVSVPTCGLTAGAACP